MELKQQLRLGAPRAAVYAALNDPELLRAAIPGCEALSQTAPDRFEATIAARVGPLAARFNGSMQVEDAAPPAGYTLVGEGKAGPAGHAKVRARVTLTEESPSVTLLEYEVKADIGGKLGQLGGAIIDRTAQKLAGEFFERFEAQLPAAAPLEATPDSAAMTAQSPTTWAVWYFLGAVTLGLVVWLLVR